MHENNISVPGWTGAGYILFDPETGAGSYKISGGSNGGFISFSSSLQKVLSWLSIILESFVDVFGDALSRVIVELKGIIERIIVYIDLIQNCNPLISRVAILSVGLLATGFASILSIFIVINVFLAFSLSVGMAFAMGAVINGWVQSCKK